MTLKMYQIFLKEISALEDLVKRVNGEKYSCHANSILDMESVTDQVSNISLNNKKVCLTVLLYFIYFKKCIL